MGLLDLKMFYSLMFIHKIFLDDAKLATIKKTFIITAAQVR